MKKVSFTIPVYNCGNYLEDCLAGIRAAMEPSCGDYEIILVNDGSKDSSGEICDRLSEQYTNVKVFHQENQGVSAARNRGIDMAEGELMIFPDADDNIEPEKLRQLIHVMDEDNTIDLLIFGLSMDYYHHGARYRRDELAYSKEGKMLSEEWQDSFYELYLCNYISPVCNKIFRKSMIEENHIRFDAGMFLYEDLDFAIRYMACCGTIYSSQEIIYHYRQQEDEGNAKRRLMRIDHLTHPVDKIEKALNEMVDRQCLSAAAKDRIKAILPHLYLVLARDKISVADRSQIRQICFDMAEWLRDKPENFTESLSEGDREYMKCVANGQISHLLANRRYTAVRHKAAIAVKNTGIYQKLKNR